MYLGMGMQGLSEASMGNSTKVSEFCKVYMADGVDGPQEMEKK